MSESTVLIVPGLRDHVALHWQTLLEAHLRAAGRPVAAVPPLGRDDLDCDTKVAAIERAAQAIDGPIVIVAHSGGCVMLAHWAGRTQRPVHAALLAAPPDFDRPPEPGVGLRRMAAGPGVRQRVDDRREPDMSRVTAQGSMRVEPLACSVGAELNNVKLGDAAA